MSKTRHTFDGPSGCLIGLKSIRLLFWRILTRQDTLIPQATKLQAEPAFDGHRKLLTHVDSLPLLDITNFPP